MTYIPGIADELFIRGEVPMTKQEIRILTLSKARITENSVVADIGAGTGSISIEAAKIAFKGMVYAIEKKAEAIDLIQKNQEKFSAENLIVMQQEAPSGMEELPACDAIIIGGSGRRLEAILTAADKKLKLGGWIVLNCITIQTLASCLQYMRTHKQYEYDAIQVQVNHLQPVGAYDMQKAANPIYIVSCRKVKAGQEGFI